MGKKSFKKGRREGAAGSGQHGSVGAGGDPMEVDPPPAVTARIESMALARQKVVLPSSVQKIKVPSFGAYIDATKAVKSEEAIRALKIPSLRGIVSTNEDPRLCAHCSAAFPDGCLSEVATMHMSCGAMVCDGCFHAHKRICVSSPDLALMHVKTGAPWALFHYARAIANTKDGHLFLRLLELAADAGHPRACHVLAAGHGLKRGPNTSSLSLSHTKVYDSPQNISLAAKYAERAIVLDPDAYRDSSLYIQQFLLALVKDGRLKEAKSLVEPLVEFETDGFLKQVLDMIGSVTFGPFYDQLAFAATGKMSQVKSVLSSVTSLYFLDKHNMSSEELRLADFESGDGIFRMTCMALKVLAEQFALSSSPLLVGLGGLICSMHHLMGQPVNRDLYRSIPTIMRDIAKVLSEVDPCAPQSLLDSEHFVLLMLTSVASHARTDPRDIQVGELDRNFRSITDTIIKNPKLPGYLRALALVLQADSFCELPHNETLYSSNCPREVVIRRKSFVLCDHVNYSENCPLKTLSARLVQASARRLAKLHGPCRHSILKRIASIRFTHGDDSSDPEELIEDMRSLYSSTVGGSGCDQCGKTLSKMLPTLLKCRRCCQAHFCSKECASLAWDTWHASSCKKLGAFSQGDLVRVKGISYNEVNGRIRNGAKATVIGEAVDGQWKVRALDPSDDGSFETDILSSRNLYHLRRL